MGALSWIRRKVYGPRREIFRYWDGSGYQWADPIAVHQTLEKEGGDWQGLLRSLDLAEKYKDKPEVSDKLRTQMDDTVGVVVELAATIRKAFNVAKLHTGASGKVYGLADAECLNLLADFMVWLADLETEYLPLHSPPKAAPLRSAEDEDTGEFQAIGPSAPSTLPETASA